MAFRMLFHGLAAKSAGIVEDCDQSRRVVRAGTRNVGHGVLPGRVFVAENPGWTTRLGVAKPHHNPAE